jgi:hypothetical protein
MVRNWKVRRTAGFPFVTGVAVVFVTLTAGMAGATTPTPSPTQGHCATTTPEPLYVDPVVSPTDELTQTVYVRTGNADRLEITSGAGTFVGEFPFDRVDVSLLPNTANHLHVSMHVRPIYEDGCKYGDYTLTTTRDFRGAPLTIVQGTTCCATPTPTVSIEGATPTPFELCAPLAAVVPPMGPAGSVVMIQGVCYAIHSGGSADVFLDDTLIGGVSGSTGGYFGTLLQIPPGAVPGRHVIRLEGANDLRLSSGPFDVSLPPLPCAGDCDHDGRVDVGEVVSRIGIALGRLDRSTCFDLASVERELTIVDIIAAVRNAMQGCPPPLEPETFAGTYDVFAGEVSELASTLPFQVYPGEVSVLDGELILQFEFFPGKFDLSGPVGEDGSVELAGVFEQNEADPVEATGSILLGQTHNGEWIGGDVVFDPPGPLESQTLRLFMQR